MTVEPRFPVLRTLAGVLEVVGVVLAIVALVMGISRAAVPGYGAGGPVSYLIGVITAGLVYLYFRIIAEAIRVALAIEENTRATSLWIERLMNMPRPGPPPP